MEFGLPSGHSRKRDDNKKQAIDLVCVVEPREESNTLNRLSKPHLIRQYHAVVPEKKYFVEKIPRFYQRQISNETLQ